MDDISALIAQITAAFEGVSRGDGVSLREGRVLDNCGSEKKRAQARALDTETRWQDVSHDDLDRYEASLCYFDAEGFRYYLPAYMLYNLTNADARGKDGTYSSIVFYVLDMPVEPNLRDLHLEHYSLLTPPQREAVCRFLQFYAAHGWEFVQEDASHALAAYWGQFCANPQYAIIPAAPSQEPTDDTHP